MARPISTEASKPSCIRQHRCRLWRYRHQSALCATRGGGRRARRHTTGVVERAGGARRRVADPVGADRHRHAEIRADPAARRQPRRGRHAVADGAGAARRPAQGAGVVVAARRSCAALFYGDAIITPAISVLSAVEGLKLVTPAFEPYVVPITVLILVVLFAVQSRGTARSRPSSARSRCVWFVVDRHAAASCRSSPTIPTCSLALNPC